MADYIILQNAPWGPLLGKQLLCMLNVIILCLHILQLVCCEWKERKQKCTASERHCWLIQNHRHLLLGKVALLLCACTHTRAHTHKTIFSGLVLKWINSTWLDRHIVLLACSVVLYKSNLILYLPCQPYHVHIKFIHIYVSAGFHQCSDHHSKRVYWISKIDHNYVLLNWI